MERNREALACRLDHFLDRVQDLLLSAKHLFIEAIYCSTTPLFFGQRVH